MAVSTRRIIHYLLLLYASLAVAVLATDDDDDKAAFLSDDDAVLEDDNGVASLRSKRLIFGTIDVEKQLQQQQRKQMIEQIKAKGLQRVPYSVLTNAAKSLNQKNQERNKPRVRPTLLRPLPQLSPSNSANGGGGKRNPQIAP